MPEDTTITYINAKGVEVDMTERAFDAMCTPTREFMERMWEEGRTPKPGEIIYHDKEMASLNYRINKEYLRAAAELSRMARLREIAEGPITATALNQMGSYDLFQHYQEEGRKRLLRAIGGIDAVAKFFNTEREEEPMSMNIKGSVWEDLKERGVIMETCDYEGKKYELLKPITLLAMEEAGAQPGCSDFQRFTDKAMNKGYGFNGEIPFLFALSWRKTNFLFDHGFIREVKVEPEVTYKVGDWFESKFGKNKYILMAQPKNKAYLGNTSGNFWDAPIEVKNLSEITEEEFNRIAWGRPGEFTPVPNPYRD